MITFEELFENAVNYGSIEQPRNEAHRQALSALYNLKFNNWLANKKGWLAGNAEQYETLLTKRNWLEFIQHEKELVTEKKAAFEAEKKSWHPPQADKITEQGTPTFTNNFDNIKPAEIYKHFKAGLVEKGYLTEQELYEYLKAAFELKTIPETRFKIKYAKKGKIEAVFYNYYRNVAGKIHGDQRKYAALLGDYFDGYKTTTVSSNFSKSVY